MAKTLPTAESADSDLADSAGGLGNILQEYLVELKSIRATAAGVAETSYYPAISNLFNAVGKTLKPRVRCIMNLKNLGAGMPDGGLFTADQFQRSSDAAPKAGQLPVRGAIEAKGPKPHAKTIAQSDQVKEYLKAYGIVLVCNLREFLIVERAPGNVAVERETFVLVEDEKSFWQNAVSHPRATAQRIGAQFTEFIKRACLHAAPVVNPKDVAWFLASYARDALYRVEQQKELPALQAIRSALEEALGMRFTAEKGEHFFRSTLVQTLFYGVFSAWVRWHKDNPAPRENSIGGRRNGRCTFPSSAPFTRRSPRRANWVPCIWWKSWIGPLASSIASIEPSSSAISKMNTRSNTSTSRFWRRTIPNFAKSSAFGTRRQRSLSTR